MSDDLSFEDAGTLVGEQRFAIGPEWVIDAEIDDCAFRLYAVLLRYGQASGPRPVVAPRRESAERAHPPGCRQLDRLEVRLREATIGAPGCSSGPAPTWPHGARTSPG